MAGFQGPLIYSIIGENGVHERREDQAGGPQQNVSATACKDGDKLRKEAENHLKKSEGGSEDSKISTEKT